MIQKQKREVDKKYLSFIREQRCLVGYVCTGDIVYHHTKTRGAGGSDYLTIPLCHKHHVEVHQVGVKTFQEIYNIDFENNINKLKKKWSVIDEVKRNTSY